MEEEYSNSYNVFCDGGGAVEGHPAVYLEINKFSGIIHCPYCSKKFIYK